jgi:Flp pilus assembly protein TadG
VIFRSCPAASVRHGAMAVLAAILAIPLLGLVAFTVDLGWIVHTQNELQSTADAAALAGAPYLADGWVQYYLPGQSATNQASVLKTAQANASQAAINFAGYNSAGGVKLTLLQSDIEFGYTDASSNYTPLSSYSGFPNTIKVTLRRDNTANTSLSLFFAPVLGVTNVNLTASAAATLQSGTIQGFGKTSGSGSTLQTFETPSWILPMTYDVNHWNNFLATGQSPDGTTTTDASGNPTLAVYPSVKFAGDFGLLSLDQANDGASTISNWITNGTSSSSLQTEYSAGLLPLPATPPSTPDWNGNAGLRESDIQAAKSAVGQTYLMPLFKPVNPGTAPNYTDYQAGVGTGTGYDYTIVGFAGIKVITSHDGNVIVQPAAVVDPNASYSSGSTSSSTSLQTVFAAPRLTQ